MVKYLYKATGVRKFEIKEVKILKDNVFLVQSRSKKWCFVEDKNGKKTYELKENIFDSKEQAKKIGAIRTGTILFDT